MKALCALLLVSLAVAGIAESYYELLGVPRNANDDQIKKAFKKLSLQFHPDRNKENREQAQRKYAKISTAYDVLIDPEKRRAYDIDGEKGVSDWEQNQAEKKRIAEWRKIQKQQNRVYPSIYGGTEVFEIEPETEEKFRQRKVMWLANFYHPTCGHCNQYKAEYSEIAKKLAGIIVVAAINCSSNFDFCQDLWIQEYPSVILFPADPSEPFYRHWGDRSTETIMELISSRLPSYVRLVNKNNIEDFMQRKLPKVLYFNNKRNTPPVLKHLSHELLDKVVIGEVQTTDSVLTARFEVNDFPLVVGLAENGVKQTYRGEMLAKPLLNWILTFSASAFGRSAIEEFTPELESKGVCQPNDPTICVLLFSDSDSSLAVLRLKSIAPEFKKDRIAFFWVNRSKYSQTFARFGDAAGIILKARRNKVQAFLAVETLTDTLAAVATGAGTFEALATPLVLNPTKTDL